MNPGLIYLHTKWPLTVVRRMRRQFQGVRGALKFIGVASLLLIIAGPQVFVHVRGNAAGLDHVTHALHVYGPAAFLLLLLMTATRSGGIHFSPADIQFLFPAPVGRRELLVYDALKKLRLQVLSGLFISVFVLGYAGRWYAAPVAAILLLALMQFWTQTMGLLLAAMEARYGKGARRLLLFGLLALVTGCAAIAFQRTPAGGGGSAVFQEFATLPPIAQLSWLTRPVIEVYLAGDFATLASWASLTLLLLAGLLGLMVAFDLAYTEGALKRAQEVSRVIARMRSGGVFAGTRARSGGLHVPQLPYLGGAGPVAWRQLQELTRNYAGVLMLAGMMLLLVGMFIVMPRLVATGGAAPPAVPVTFSVVMLLVITNLMNTHLTFDFRRDLDRMALLKSLPISAFTLAVGQVIPGALLLSALQLVAIAAISFFLEPPEPGLLIGILVGLLPLNALFLALDNMLFLLMPYRVIARDPGRMPFMGRLIAVMFLKLALVLLLVGLTAIPVSIAWFASGRSPLITSLTAAGFVLVCTIPMLLAVAAAFRRYDVSREIPE